MSAEAVPPNPPAAAPATPDHDALPPGTRFGEFEILRVLGVGGFGIVYLAQDHSLERQVALKEYMPSSLAARGAGAMITVRSGSFAETYAIGLRSFINEARLLARFDHPALVKVYRFWEDNGTAYMVMPYLQGITLRDARRRMAQPPDEAWIRSVLDPMLDAIEQLHREGVFHRDIAPDNILLPPEGTPILLDFGAARRVISDRTQSLTAILKPSYAPIEQYAEMTAMRQGPWTDIYAMGAVLHYLLFGQPPAPATARAVQDDAEQIEQRVVAGVSPRFMSIVAWMLGVRPLDRPQNVALLRAALNGQVPIPSRRHEVTVPGKTSLMPVGQKRPDFQETVFEAPFDPTLRVEGAYSDATRLDTAHQPTALAPHTEMGAAGPLAQPLAPRSAAAAAGGGAPMRATPPGAPPPVHVPPPRAGAKAPQGLVGEAAPAASRRVLVWGGLAAAAAVALVVLWQFVGLMRSPQPALAADTAASAAPRVQTPAPPPAPAGYTGPSVAQVASVPAWGNMASSPAANVPAVPVPPPVAASAVPVGAGASSAARAGRLKPTASRASESSEPLAEPARVAAVGTAPPGLASGRESSVVAAPASAREACGDRKFIALAVCLDRECEQPRFRDSPECVRLLAVKRRRAEP